MNPYDEVIKGLKFGVPRIIRLFCHDLRHRPLTGRFNTLSGFLAGKSRLNTFTVVCKHRVRTRME